MNSDQQQQQQQQQQTEHSKRRRYRIPRSCDRCRASKVKCVFENGRCNACAKAGLTCTFANPGSLTERPPTYKDVEQLTARIRSLERLLHAVDPTIDLNDLPNPFRLASRFYDESSLSTTTNPLSPQNRCASTSKLTTVQEREEARTDQIPPSSEPSSRSFPGSAIVLTGFDGLRVPSKAPITTAHWSEPDKSKPMGEYTGVTIQPESYIGPNSLFSTPEAAAFRLPNLPPISNTLPAYPVDEFIRTRRAEYVATTNCFYPEPDLELELIKIYFQHFHPLIPIIHPSTFHALHQSGLAHSDKSFRALCLLIFSIASRHSPDPRVLFDLAGNPQSSRQFCGLRYAYAAYLSLFQLFDHQTSLFELQAFVLLVVASLGALQPTISWIFVEQGLLRAQESGAHREVHKRWNSNPLQDYLRRQAFFQLYELDHKISATLDRTPSIEAEDFDLKPPLPQPGDPFGIFINPYSPIPREVREIYIGFDVVRVSLLQVGSLHSMLPLLNLIKADKNSPKAASSAKTLKNLVDQIDKQAAKWFDQLPLFLKRSNVESGPEQLMFSVLVTTSYYEFQQLIHRTLFDYEEGSERHNGTGADGEVGAGAGVGGRVGGGGGGEKRKRPHMSRCVKYAVSAIQEMSKLRLRGLLTSTFFWLPARITLAVILLICSIRKQRKFINRLEDLMRRDHISLGIQILDELAPSAHTATVYSKTLKILVDLLEVENPSVLESLASPPSDETDNNSPSPPSVPPSAPPPPPVPVVAIAGGAAAAAAVASNLPPLGNVNPPANLPHNLTGNLPGNPTGNLPRNPSAGHSFVNLTRNPDRSTDPMNARPTHPAPAQVRPLPRTLPVYNEHIRPQVPELLGPSDETSWDPLEISALAFDDPDLGLLSSPFIPPNPPHFSPHNHP
ncbi:hypothetical protein PGT21_019365 [Puccinia graminis f. sp. tritici]|uniref:Zn(2)-C6 fungal-type domain-containing protein n=1 Tax=Puccinia graminis f. sp. tritici TaxID=56615 RepID=A0A5B0NNI6_PUCGR|nr:hypothetical protein PGT21_019365 [Puccinia graminis f. sp. tritici]